MSSRGKLERFAENQVSKNVIEPGKPIYDEIKGNWRSKQFGNDYEIVLELACGRGEYTVGLAENIPDKNFIGVDIKGARIWQGSQQAIEKGLDNAAFLRTFILQIENFFEENEVDEIWIIFPDPRPRSRDERRRITSPRYLDIYKRLLKPGGIVHLKTDSNGLFDFTLEVLGEKGIPVLESTRDLYSSPLLDKHYGIQTYYEKRFLNEGRNINYLEFKFD